MKNKWNISIAVLLLVLANTAFCGTYNGGQGTSDDPYLIETPEDLLEIGANEADWDKYFLLTADIDLSGNSYSTALIAPDTDNSDNGFEDTPFSGVFDGNGHVIRNMTIFTAGVNNHYLALFGKLDNAEIKNLGIENAAITGGTGSMYVGALAGYADATITNCYVCGTVSGDQCVGGLTGIINYSSVSNCYAYGIIRGGNSVGGLTGKSHFSSITNCYASSVVSGNLVGGLIGRNNAGEIINCYATGSVSGDESVGGLIGSHNTSVVAYCFALCKVTGNIDVGGFAGDGFIDGYTNVVGYTSCYWDSEINPSLPGANLNQVPTGLLGSTTAEMHSQSAFTDNGWDFVGDDANGTEDIWYMQDCGLPALSWQTAGIVPSVVGLSKEDASNMIMSVGSVVFEKTARSKTVPPGYVISQEPAQGCKAAVVTIVVSSVLPYGQGCGTEEEPFQLWTPEHVNAIGLNPCDWDKHFVLMDDIDLEQYTAMTFNIIGNRTTPFTGVFDGDDYDITNLTIDPEGNFRSCLGFFGEIGPAGEVKNLNLRNVSFTGCDDSVYVGALASINKGTITDCFATGTLSGSHDVGGFVGFNKGEITNCFSAATLSGSEDVGGLVGRNNGTISNSFAACIVTGKDYIGGLTGANRQGTITNCYAIGHVRGDTGVGGLTGSNWRSTVTNCYAACTVTGNTFTGALAGIYVTGDTGSLDRCLWDSDLNKALAGIGIGDDLNDGAIGKSTLDMQTKATFIDAGWDFVGDNSNGNDNIWFMPGCGNPTLSWQLVRTVPDVVGLSRELASRQLYLQRNVTILKTAHSQVVDEGYVISQHPPAGCHTSVVTIVVSDGFSYQAGTGTESDPYQIYNPLQLNAIGSCPEDWDKHFVLMADIDLSEYSWIQYNIIGDGRSFFTGVFDGNGYSMSNFSFVSSGRDYVGIFGSVGSKGHIKNIELIGTYVNAELGDYIGALAGFNYGTITNCYVQGTVIGDSNVGALVGCNEGSITQCRTEGTVIGRAYVGGLTGTNAGGIPGRNSNGVITSSFAQVTANGERYVGGLSGGNGGQISNCYATGPISGQFVVGGLIGEAWGGIIANCYASGHVSGEEIIGGLVGIDTTHIISAYVGDTSGYQGEVEYYGSYYNCFWDRQINPLITGLGLKDDPSDIIDSYSSEMKKQKTYSDSGWDFAGEDINGTDDLWRLCTDRVSYPRLTWELARIGDFACPDGVDGEDLVYLSDRWLTGDAIADINGDSVVNMFDYVIFAEYWMAGL